MLTEASFEREHPILTAVIGRFAGWLRRRAAARERIAELQGLGDAELDRAARALHLSRRELDLTMALSPGFVDLVRRRMGILLTRRLAALGFDPRQVAGRTSMPRLVQVCAGCDHHARCEDDLARRPDDPVWRLYCPNAGALAALPPA